MGRHLVKQLEGVGLAAGPAQHHDDLLAGVRGRRDGERRAMQRGEDGEGRGGARRETERGGGGEREGSMRRNPGRCRGRSNAADASALAIQSSADACDGDGGDEEGGSCCCCDGGPAAE